MALFFGLVKGGGEEKNLESIFLQWKWLLNVLKLFV